MSDDESMLCPKCGKEDWESNTWVTCEGGILLPCKKKQPRIRKTVYNKCKNCDWKQTLVYKYGCLIELRADDYEQ